MRLSNGLCVLAFFSSKLSFLSVLHTKFFCLCPIVLICIACLINFIQAVTYLYIINYNMSLLFCQQKFSCPQKNMERTLPENLPKPPYLERIRIASSRAENFVLFYKNQDNYLTLLCIFHQIIGLSSSVSTSKQHFRPLFYPPKDVFLICQKAYNRNGR